MIAVGSDHGGLELKRAVIELLQGRGLECEDYGTNGTDSVDYPDFGAKVANAVSKGAVEKGF